jgi:PAS domain S-box-containing protein
MGANLGDTIPARRSWHLGRLKPLPSYFFATVTTIAVFELRVLLSSQLGSEPTLAIFTVPIMLSAFAGGLGAGLLSTLLSYCLISYYLLPPYHTFLVAAPAQRWNIFFVMLAGVVISALNERLHRAHRKAHITVHERAKEIAADSRRELNDVKAAIDAHAIVAITDTKGLISYVSDSFCAISKYSREELLGQDHRIINSGHHPEEFFSDLWKAIAQGQVWKGEIKDKAKDGSCYWGDTTIVPFLNKEGKPRHYIAISADITERRLAEESARRFAAIVEFSDDAIVGKSLDGIVYSWNPGAERLFGYTAKEVIGKTLVAFIPPERPNEEVDILARIVRGEYIQHFETIRVRKDGTRIDVSVTISPIKDDAGRVIGASKIARDITERKRFEHTLQQTNIELEGAKAAAEKANLAKSEFLAGMSHELRTPLNGIIGFTEFLIDEKPGPLRPKQKEYLGDVLNSGRHLLQLINDVLDLAKIEAGKMELHLETFAVRKAVEEVTAVVQSIASKKQIVIDTEIKQGLDAVILDQSKFKQVLYNLLSNAIKFSDKGGKVGIRARRLDPHQLELQFSDAGIGIKPQDIERLFNEFEQLDSGTARRFEGTGLGLALTKKIIEFQGGCIRVKSEPGQGSVFTVVMPTRVNSGSRL